MGLTSLYDLPYPEMGDPPAGPTQIEALAAAVERQIARADSIIADLRDQAAALSGKVTVLEGTAWADWTPTISGGGSATFTSVGGRWRRTGVKTVAFTMQFNVVQGGSGSSFVTLTLPTAPSRARRWVFPGGQEAGNPRSGLYATTFTGGTGTTLDRIRFNGNSNFVGSMLEMNQIYSFSGVYEEA